jgi:hypothetical protein
LYDLSKRASAQAQNPGHSGCTLISEKAGFHASSVFQLDDQRNQPSVGEMSKIRCPVRLVKTEMVRQVHKLQMGAYRSKFLVRYGQKQFVGNGLPGGVRSFAWLRDYNLSQSHLYCHRVVIGVVYPIHGIHKGL